jgi:hypothetical protein
MNDLELMAEEPKTEPTQPAEPKPKRQYHKRRKYRRRLSIDKLVALRDEVVKKPKEAPALPDVNLEGMRHAKMGSNGCPIACGPTCVITGEICAHPDLGGLQSKYLTMPDVKKRYDQAVLYLRKLDAEIGK